MQLIEPFGAGGGPDIVARALAGPLAEHTGRPVEVVNHPGGGSTAAPALALEAPADGETLLINTSAHAYSAAAVANLPYDPLRDFAAVAALTTQAYVVVASARTGLQSLRELIDAAKATPGALRFGSTGLGTATHIGTAELNLTVGISAVHVRAGPSDAIADVVAKAVRGEVAYVMLPTAIAAGPIAAGDLRALGVTTAQRSPALPSVPTIAEAGAPGYEFPIWYGAWVHADTPPTIVGHLAADLAAAKSHPDFHDMPAAHAMRPLSIPSDEFASFVADETRRAARVISREHPI